MSNYGIVEYFGCNDTSYPCGYCKGVKQNSDHGMWAHTLLNINYQNLIDRNWRRSGKYCYKPNLSQSCCPMYTIRCDALNFKLKKSQKKVMKKFNHFLMTGEKHSKRNESQIHLMNINQELGVEPLLDTTQVQNIAKHGMEIEEPVSEPVPEPVTDPSANRVTQNVVIDKIENKSIVKNNRKAKHIRIERKLNRIMSKEKCDQKTAQNIMRQQFKQKIIRNDKTKSLEDYFNQIENSVNNKHKLKITYVSTTTEEYKETFEASHKVYQKYQFSIHGDPFDKCSCQQFKRFLIDSPLENESFEISDELPDHFGSYHQQYWLDNQLIAVGVIDILPKCVSSVYLYYDPEFDFLSLGTYSALREIYLVRRLQRFIPDLKYYYMGFYIHSCPKMRYKAKFTPSDLLCGETFSWLSIEKCLPKLDVTKYCRFEDSLNAIDLDGNQIKDEEIKILFSRTVITFKEYKPIRTIDDNELQDIKQYSKLIGRKCSKRIALFRQ